MALTVADLLAIPDLELELAGGASGVSGAIRWVHSTELEDPTPWLKGGELLLTTGLGVGTSPAQQRRYLRRLTGAGLAGLGFGLGFGFQRVPKTIVTEADRAGFPVFAVPYPIPFIAITEAVFSRLVAEQYDVLSRSLDAEHSLTRTVLDGGGVAGIVRSLAAATGGWALLLDLHGDVVAAAPDDAVDHLATVWGELRSPRAESLRFTLSLVDGGNHIAIQPVIVQGEIESFLAFGHERSPAQFDRIVSSHALNLLALEFAKTRAVSDVERRLKGDLLDQLVAGTLGIDEARFAIERFGFDLSQPASVVAFAGTEEPAVLARHLEEVLARRSGVYLASPVEDIVFVVVQHPGLGSLSQLRAAVAARSGGTVLAGAGNPVPLDRIAQGVREARYALQVCRTEGREEAEFADLGTYQLLLSLQDPEALRTFASSVLAPLDRYDEQHGGDLRLSLQTFLERNARWETAAAELYVHRHTLRYRIRKVEELTGRDLGSARDRMEFFLALRARDLLETDNARTRGSRSRSGRRRVAEASP
ncbi:MAG TPA: hypothetical protein DIU14_04845 [Actinobacteria bacterium]|nr:hypothetical protein [Actinomycetota bacterium]